MAHHARGKNVIGRRTGAPGGEWAQCGFRIKAKKTSAQKPTFVRVWWEPACVGDVYPLGVPGVERLAVLEPGHLWPGVGLGRQALEDGCVSLTNPHGHRHHLEVVAHH